MDLTFGAHCVSDGQDLFPSFNSGWEDSPNFAPEDIVGNTTGGSHEITIIPDYSPVGPGTSAIGGTELDNPAMSGLGHDAPLRLRPRARATVQYRIGKPRPQPRNFEETTVKSVSQDILCEGYHSLLECELPHWIAHGLWHESAKPLEPPSRIPTSPNEHVGLERAYLVVCQLESRIGQDMIRSRMALVQLHLEYTRTHEVRQHAESHVISPSTVGRGSSSHVIDRILQSIHNDWDVLDQKRHSELRGKFHYRKKCGKRWAQLADTLGRGILLLSSAKLASAV